MLKNGNRNNHFAAVASDQPALEVNLFVGTVLQALIQRITQSWPPTKGQWLHEVGYYAISGPNVIDKTTFTDNSWVGHELKQKLSTLL